MSPTIEHVLQAAITWRLALNNALLHEKWALDNAPEGEEASRGVDPDGQAGQTRGETMLKTFLPQELQINVLVIFAKITENRGRALTSSGATLGLKGLSPGLSPDNCLSAQ